MTTTNPETLTTEIERLITAADERDIALIEVGDMIARMAPAIERGHIFRSVGMMRRDRLTAEQTARLIVDGALPLGATYPELRTR